MAISAPVVSRYSQLYPNNVAESSTSSKSILLFANFRTMEGPTIRKKLAVIESTFPHDDSTSYKQLGQVYDDVLELSRPRANSAKVRQHAWKALLVQIGSRQTLQLQESLAEKPTHEVIQFISEAIACMPEECTMPDIIRNAMHVELLDAYLDSQIGEIHPAIPFIDFTRLLIRKNQLLCPALTGGGFLDMMFCIYAATLVPRTIYVGKTILSVQPVAQGKTQKALLHSCSAALTVLSKNTTCVWTLERHPLHILWPRVRSSPFTRLFTMLVEHPSLDLRRSIRKVSRAHMMWRILIPGPVFQKLSGQEGVHELYDICRFLRPNDFGPYLADWAVARYLTYIALDGRHWDTLVSALFERSAEYATSLEVFSRIVQSLLYSAKSIQSKGCHNIPLHAVDHFLEFATSVIEARSTWIKNNPQSVGRPPQHDIILAFFDAGILALWFATAKDEIKNTSEFSVALHADLPTPGAPVKHTFLLRAIRERGLGEFLTDGHMTHRRKVWCRLFKGLLDREFLGRGHSR